MSFRKILIKGFLLAAVAGLVTSLRVVSTSDSAHGDPGRAALVLYSEPGFLGRSLLVTGSLPDLPREVLTDGSVSDWNDNVRSIRVIQGTWRLYQHGRFNTELDETPLESLNLDSKAPAMGWSALVSASASGEGMYPDGASGCFGEDISSIELVSTENLPEWALALRGKHE